MTRLGDDNTNRLDRAYIAAKNAREKVVDTYVEVVLCEYQRGRKDGIEEAAKLCETQAEFYHQRSTETDNPELACEREYGSEACFYTAVKIRSLSAKDEVK